MHTSRKVTLLFFLFSILLSSCTDHPDKVLSSLKASGNNRGEIEKVLLYYKNDSIKLNAAYFLIANMKDKGTYVNELIDRNGEVVDFEISDFKNDLEENKWLDSVENIRGKLRVHEEFLPDLEHINSQFLINNIDNAFMAKAQSPFCKGISDADFHEYILPYRVSFEKLEFWRDTILNLFTDEQKDTIYNFSSTIEATKYIDDFYKTRFEFGGSRYFKDKKIRSYSGLIDVKTGKCSDMCNLVVYALRALGIPSGFDSIKYKRASNDVGHQWAFVIDTKFGNAIPFDPLSKNNVPGNFNLPYKNSPKVFRKQFKTINEGSIKANISIIHPDFYYNNNLDVTDEYYETINMSIPIDSMYKEPVYLNVWYKNEWKPVDYSFISNSKIAEFRNVTIENLYCLSSYQNKENKKLGQPFVIDIKGDAKYINSFKNKKEITPNILENYKIKAANKGATIYDFLTGKKVCKKVTKDDYNWMYVSKDSLTTNSFYVFSDSYKYGKVIFIDSDNNINWY